jgi:hypothetical protein
VSGNVFVENFNNAGLEVNYQSNSLPASITTPGDQNIDIENNVFSYAGSEVAPGKLALNIGDPGFDGTWKNNLQTINKTTSAYIVVPAQTGDLPTGTSPGFDADYLPLAFSPLIDAGYSGALSLGLARSATDYLGVAWGTPRSIGLSAQFGPAPGAPDARAGADTIATTDVAFSLSGSDSTVPSGTITYAWSKVSGPGAVTFSSSTVAQPSVTIDTAGTYVLRLTVSTAESPGTTDTDDVTVVVSDYVAPVVGGAALLDTGVYVLGGLAHVYVVPA